MQKTRVIARHVAAPDQIVVVSASKKREDLVRTDRHYQLASPTGPQPANFPRLYWMSRKEWDYEQCKKFSPHPGQPGTGVGVQSNTE